VSFLKDVQYAARTLRQSPGFTAVAAATLAVAIGANTAIFSFLDAVLLKPLPYPNADRIVRVLEKPPRLARNNISTLNFLDWQKDNEVFEFLSAQSGQQATLTGGDEPVQLRGGLVSAGYFQVFGVRPALGRTFLPGEDQPARTTSSSSATSSGPPSSAPTRGSSTVRLPSMGSRTRSSAFCRPAVRSIARSTRCGGRSRSNRPI
jgi:hypothetical protein